MSSCLWVGFRNQNNQNKIKSVLLTIEGCQTVIQSTVFSSVFQRGEILFEEKKTFFGTIIFTSKLFGISPEVYQLESKFALHKYLKKHCTSELV